MTKKKPVEPIPQEFPSYGPRRRSGIRMMPRITRRLSAWCRRDAGAPRAGALAVAGPPHRVNL